MFICTYFNVQRRVNIVCGRAEERILLTGLHAVADIYCSSCRTILGWKYVSGVYVLVPTEKALVGTLVHW